MSSIFGKYCRAKVWFGDGYTIEMCGCAVNLSYDVGHLDVTDFGGPIQYIQGRETVDLYIRGGMQPYQPKSLAEAMAMAVLKEDVGAAQQLADMLLMDMARQAGEVKLPTHAELERQLAEAKEKLSQMAMDQLINESQEMGLYDLDYDPL